MSLYKSWEDLTSGQTSETFDAFWGEYSDAEIKLYTHILESATGKFTGKISDISAEFGISTVLVVGFVDGIKTSLNKEIEVENLDENSEIDLDINFEKLYFNMLDVDAKHLYTIEAWSNIFAENKLDEITKAYKKTKTIVKEKTPGRNEPCSCGSGKKYKHCCGK